MTERKSTLSSRNAHYLILLLVFVLRFKIVRSFKSCPSFGRRSYCRPRVHYDDYPFVGLSAAKGFGGGGFGKKERKKKKSTKELKRAQQQLLDQYGGDIARGTSERIQQAMQALPQHVQLAAQLYQQVQRWDAYMSSLSVMQQTRIPTQDVEGARRAKQELERLYDSYELSDRHLHNLFQRVTWDASADAKAARARMGSMKENVEERIDRACSIVAQAARNAEEGGKCLDVGCGPGAMVPYLIKQGLKPQQIVGIDLSPEMVRNAQRTHRGVKFVAGDFLEYNECSFDGILFCSSLHDFPSRRDALQQAAFLLRPKGKLVIVHAQGADHVEGQKKANPVMVRESLPLENDLIDMNLGLEIEDAPTLHDEGYLAVLIKPDE